MCVNLPFLWQLVWYCHPSNPVQVCSAQKQLLCHLLVLLPRSVKGVEDKTPQFFSQLKTRHFFIAGRQAGVSYMKVVNGRESPSSLVVRDRSWLWFASGNQTFSLCQVILICSARAPDE